MSKRSICLQEDSERLATLCNVVLERLQRDKASLYGVVIATMEVRQEFYEADYDLKEAEVRIRVNAATDGDNAAHAHEVVKYIIAGMHELVDGGDLVHVDTADSIKAGPTQ